MVRRGEEGGGASRPTQTCSIRPPGTIFLSAYQFLVLKIGREKRQACKPAGIDYATAVV